MRVDRKEMLLLVASFAFFWIFTQSVYLGIAITFLVAYLAPRLRAVDQWNQQRALAHSAVAGFLLLSLSIIPSFGLVIPLWIPLLQLTALYLIVMLMILGFCMFGASSYEKIIKTLFFISVLCVIIGSMKLHVHAVWSVQVLFGYGLWYLQFLCTISALVFGVIVLRYRRIVDVPYSVAAGIALLVAICLRLWRLGSLGLWWDEGITGMVVSRILETGLPIEPWGIQYYWRGVVYHYLVAFSAWIFGPSEFSLRLVSVAAGIGVLVVAYLFSRKIQFGYALGVLLFLVFSPYNIEHSRFARFYMLHAFFFMLAIYLGYEGFVQKRRLHLYAMIPLAFLMVHTVQLGSAVVFVVLGYFSYQGMKAILNNDVLRFMQKHTERIVVGGIVMSIAIFCRSIIARWFQKDLPAGLLFYGRDAVELLIDPEMTVLTFFNAHHIPIIFLIIGLLYFVLIARNELKGESCSPYTFLTSVFLLTLFGFELYHGNFSGSRLYLMFEAPIVMISLYALYRICSLLPKSRYFYFSMIFVLLLLMQPNAIELVNRHYGDPVDDDPFRATRVAKFRSDDKTTYEYLSQNMRPGDVWMSVMGPEYFYIQDLPDYVINQRTEWKEGSVYDQRSDEYRMREYGSVLLSTTADVRRVIHQYKRVWIVVSGASVDVLSTRHVKPEFKDFLVEHQGNVVYESPDGISKVFLFI